MHTYDVVAGDTSSKAYKSYSSASCHVVVARSRALKLVGISLR